MTGGHILPGRQLPLALHLSDYADFFNFVPGANAELLHQLQDSSDRREHFIYLSGVAGSGKSHLLQAACQALGNQAVYLPMAELHTLDPQMLEDLEQLALIAIDDIQVIAGNAPWEQALFHLYNRVREGAARLLVAGDASPTALPLQLADLRSRLAWGPVYQLHELSEEQKLQALILRAERRGMVLSPEVGRYLLKRSRRDMHSLFQLFERLDRESLAAQRRLTIPFARELLGD